MKWSVTAVTVMLSCCVLAQWPRNLVVVVVVHCRDSVCRRSVSFMLLVDCSSNQSHLLRASVQPISVKNVNWLLCCRWNVVIFVSRIWRALQSFHFCGLFVLLPFLIRVFSLVPLSCCRLYFDFPYLSMPDVMWSVYYKIYWDDDNALDCNGWLTRVFTM